MKKLTSGFPQIKSALLATFLAFAMALCMVPAVTGGSALAADDVSSQAAADATYSIAIRNQAATVEAGQQLDMNDFINLSRSTLPDVYHFDFMIEPSSSSASINKHSGILTANAAGTVTVNIYLIGSAIPTEGVKGLCDTSLAQASKEVTITTPVSEYGFQGGSNAIKMISPTVTSYSGDLATGYTNTIDEAPETDGYVYFTYQTTTGFTRWATPERYTERNAGNISVKLGNTTYTLGENQNVLSVSSVDQTNQQITLRVATTGLSSQTGTLTFDAGLCGNSDTRLLETTVTFNFTVVR